MKALIYKLVHKNIILLFYASFIKTKSKILYDIKKSIKEKKFKDKNTSK